MKVLRNIDILHPLLIKSVKIIQSEIIDKHNFPIRLFETGRNHDRHELLIKKGKTKDPISGHLYNLVHIPPLYPTAVDYVYYDSKWSWNLRDSTIKSWYNLFGNLVLDLCPELQWSGENRKAVNLCHFALKRDSIIAHLDYIPCVV